MIGVTYNESTKKIVAILKSYVCSWNKCTFCCFYKEAAQNLSDLLQTAKDIFQKINEIIKENPVNQLSFFNGGSFFELPFSVISDISYVTEQKLVEVESRPEFLSLDRIRHLFMILNAKKLIMRIGFESIYDNIRNGLLSKGISDKEIKRVLKLRDSIKNEYDEKVDLITYVLFGIEGIDEQSVKVSVNEFNKHLDGVIAVKYRRYFEQMPNEVKVSQSLLEFLRNNCLEVDLAESEIWRIVDPSIKY